MEASPTMDSAQQQRMGIHFAVAFTLFSSHLPLRHSVPSHQLAIRKGNVCTKNCQRQEGKWTGNLTISVFWQLLSAKSKGQTAVFLCQDKKWFNELCRTCFLGNIYETTESTKLDNYAKQQVPAISTLAASLKQLGWVQIFTTLDSNPVLVGKV